MTKYTKRQFEADLTANKAAQAANAALLETFPKRLESGELIADLSDDWNNAHDETYRLEQEAQDIERRYRCRNWNWQDHSFANLVSQNID